MLFRSRPGEFVHVLGDAHLYLNHMEQVQLQLARRPLPLPVMKINPAVRSIFDFRYEDFELEGYQSHPAIPAPIPIEADQPPEISAFAVRSSSSSHTLGRYAV